MGLRDENRALRDISTKKMGLVWDEEREPEQVVTDCKEKLPVLKEVESKAITPTPNSNLPTNIIIEGDNYHALSVLNYTHKEKIDVIYIDPPYNTGARDWRYNNDYVDVNDNYRHSKWLQFMSKRLSLAKDLLSPDGFIILSIDENEIHNIRHILDEIFGESNKVGMVTVLHNPKGRNQAKFFSENSEFFLVYAKNKNIAKFNKVAIDNEVRDTFNLEDERGRYRLEEFMRRRTTWLREARPDNFYSIYVSKNLNNLTLDYEKDYLKILPIANGIEYAWKRKESTFKEENEKGFFLAKETPDGIKIFHKYREQQVFKNVWTNKKYQSEFNGTNLLKKILGKNIFNFPKSLYLIVDILKITSKKNSIVLDFFAGSGTTGHAVLEINKEDGGNRQFILCTNNEGDICTKVAYPRIKKNINGYDYIAGNKKKKKVKVKGLGGNLRYFKTDFISYKDKANDSVKFKLMKNATEMICIKEDAFEKIKDENNYKIFKGRSVYLGILFNEGALITFRNKIKKINKKTAVYVFSLFGLGQYENQFNNLKNVKVVPVPSAIMKVYKRLFYNIKE